MCGCGKGGVFAASSSKVCKDRVKRLSDTRTKLSILFNIAKSQELKGKYREDKEEINNLIIQIYETGICPEHAFVVQLENEVNNEYSKYYNS